jgi:hypothetical protein
MKRIDTLLANTGVVQGLLASQVGVMSAVRQAVAALDSSSRDAVLFEEGLQHNRANGRLQQLLQGYGVQRL